MTHSLKWIGPNIGIPENLTCSRLRPGNKVVVTRIPKDVPLERAVTHAAFTRNPHSPPLQCSRYEYEQGAQSPTATICRNLQLSPPTEGNENAGSFVELQGQFVASAWRVHANSPNLTCFHQSIWMTSTSLTFIVRDKRKNGI